MTLYPIIQLVMSATLNQIDSALTNNQFFFDDMLIVTVLAVLMTRTHPHPRLDAGRPTDDLFDPSVLLSILGQLALCIIFFFINLGLTTSQPWFCSLEKAKSMLDQETFLPKNASLGSANYPCYPYIV
jgi:cation-transporting ATPase 13A3/4/5